MSFSAAVITISDAAAQGLRDEDRSGDAAEAMLREMGFEVETRVVVPDEADRIEGAITEAARSCRLVVTTGGTGLGPRDVTPEATRAVLEREAPGIAERIRSLSLEGFPRAALSRGIAGVRARTLVVNLPGSTGGVRDGLAALDPIVDHARDILRDRPTEHSDGGADAQP